MKHITPSRDDLGQRLDRYMRKIFPGAKLGEVYEALRTKKITLAGKKLPENTKLRAGDILHIDIAPDILKIWEQREVKTRIIHEKLDPARMLYQDNDILVYDKPSGLIVHSPDHKTDEVSLIEQIEDYLVNTGWKPSGTFAHPALAHRIDRDTSGVIISCLNRLSYEHMAEQFRTRKVEKTYHALVAGVPEPREGIIDAPLLRIDSEKTDEAKVIVDPAGQTAETTYKTLKTFPIDSGKLETQNSKLKTFSLIELHPKTGRTHQIRVHMAHIGNPLIGDKRYGGPSVTRFPELSHLHGRRGHLLHAERIEFRDISSEEKTIVSRSYFSSLPAD